LVLKNKNNYTTNKQTKKINNKNLKPKTHPYAYRGNLKIELLPPVNEIWNDKVSSLLSLVFLPTLLSSSN